MRLTCDVGLTMYWFS